MLDDAVIFILLLKLLLPTTLFTTNIKTELHSFKVSSHSDVRSLCLHVIFANVKTEGHYIILLHGKLIPAGSRIMTSTVTGRNNIVVMYSKLINI